MREAAKNGLLGDAVTTETVLNVPVADRERAAQILQAAGIQATTVVGLTIDPEQYRILKNSFMASAEAAKAKGALAEVAEQKVSYRIRYRRATA